MSDECLFAAEFLEQARHLWKSKTLETNEHFIRKYILPALAI